MLISYFMQGKNADKVAYYLLQPNNDKEISDLDLKQAGGYIRKNKRRKTSKGKRTKRKSRRKRKSRGKRKGRRTRRS